MKISINESDLKNIVKTIVTELDTKTYSDVMNKTSDFPWTTHFNRGSNKYNDPKQKGNKEQRVNTLARGRFLEEYNKEFPIGTTKIVTTDGIYSFAGVKFRTNYTMYDLIFKADDNNADNKHIWLKKSNNGFFIDFADRIDITDQNSINLINDMLKYNN